MVVMRNLTAHVTVVHTGGSMSMINRDISVSAGAPNPNAPDHEEPMLAASKIGSALAAYEARLKTENVRTDKSGKTTSMWDRERKNVEGALRWNAKLAGEPTPRVPLSGVFKEAINFVAGVCNFAVPPLS